MSQERDKFEAWDREVYALPDRDYVEYQGGFSNIHVNARWDAWLASRRDALEEAAQLADRNVAGTTAGGSHANGMRSMAQHLATVIRKLGEGA